MFLEKYIIDPSKYEEECPIGEGNFSTVSLVHPKNNKNIDIALKKIPVDLNDKDSQKYFMREILIMTEINHPNLIKLIGFSLPSNNDQTFKIYSEYLPNKTLSDALKNNENASQLTATQKSIIIYGIASAMKFLHKKNIVHRDLKPENIFLNADLEPVLADFGLSKICGDNITITGRLGTPYYMAPELFCEEEDENKITNKIDVYAFAVNLLSIFTTNYRFKGAQPRTIRQLVNNLKNGKRYQIPSDVPKFYESLINRCWATDPSERPSFEDIINLFDNSSEFMLEGADEKKVKEFINKVKNPNTVEEMEKMNEYCEYEEVEETEEFIF